MSHLRLLASMSVVAVAATVALPATADTAVIGEAANAMLVARDIPASLGDPAAHSFIANHKTGPTPWLCTIGDETLSGRAARHSYESIFMMDKQDRQGMVQAVFVYKDTAKAKAAWKDLVTKVKKCTGTSEVGNWQQPGGTKVTQTLTNGKTDEKYDGSYGWWVLTDLAASSAQETWTTDEIDVYFRVGNAINMLDYDQLPDGQPTVKQRETIEKLGETLDQRWQTQME